MRRALAPMQPWNTDAFYADSSTRRRDDGASLFARMQNARWNQVLRAGKDDIKQTAI